MSGAKKKCYYCSFCGKTDEEVVKLLTASGAFICNECIAVCVSVLEGRVPGHYEYDSWICPTLTEDKTA